MKVLVNRTRYDGSKFLCVDIGRYTPGNIDGFDAKLVDPFMEGLFTYGDVLIVLGQTMSGPKITNQVSIGLVLPSSGNKLFELHEGQININL